MMLDDLSDVILERVLAGRFGRPRRVYDEIDSTNAAALRWLEEEHVGEGAVVIADQQTTGRGRRGRTWFSAPRGSLMFSLVCRPQTRALRLLTTAAGCAIARALRESCRVNAAIKWPNDIVLRDRKAGGILVETRTAGGLLEAAVVGIGINLKWKSVDMPPEIAARATSIAAEVEDTGSGRVPARAELLAASLNCLDEHFALLATQEGRGEIVARANALSCVLGRHVTLRLANGDVTTGLARRICDDGGLELVIDEHAAVFAAGEIETLRTKAGS